MLYKNARNKVKTEMRKSKYTYESDLASKIKTDPKLFWSYVRSKLKTKTSLSQLKLPCGTLTNDNNQKAGLLNGFLQVCLKQREKSQYQIFQTGTLMRQKQQWTSQKM